MKARLATIGFLFIIAFTTAQTVPPEAFKFQAIIMDGNKTVKGKPIGVEISIYQGGLTGILSYSETFVEISDINGMVNLEIGRGTPVVGVFSQIPWGNGRFFISVAADPKGGTDYISMGGSELLSVPYALYSKFAAGIDGPNDTDDTNEIQQLALEDGVLKLSKNGGEINLPGNEAQNFYYADKDGDGFGDNWNVVYSKNAPNGYILQNGDCDDLDATINPNAAEIPEDGIDQNCDGIETYLDKDNDGFTSNEDCDDNDPNIFPNAEETCDGKDNNCDGLIDNDCVLGDCVELLASFLQYVDENCSDLTDSNCVFQFPNFSLLQFCIDIQCASNIAINGALPPEWDTYTYEQGAQWLISQCGNNDEDGDNITPLNGDCNDADASIYPGAQEICGDGIDQDCNGSDSLCNDQDGDGYVDINFGGKDCDDNDETVFPGAEEICGDGIDQDCDGEDLNCQVVDNDQDGYTIDDGDCDDDNSRIYPGAEEICGDGIDQDCDEDIDETCGSSQILLARNTVDGVVSILIEDVYVTYVYFTSWFTVQSEEEGPALKIFVPDYGFNLNPGDKVSFTITELSSSNGVPQATGISNLVVLSSNNDIIKLIQDVSNLADLSSNIQNYESELISVTGTIIGSFQSAGGNFQVAQFETEGITGDSGLTIRLPSFIAETIGDGCKITVNTTPLGLFNDEAQIQAFFLQEINIISCSN